MIRDSLHVITFEDMIPETRRPERVQCKSQNLFWGFVHQGFDQRGDFNNHFFISSNPENPKLGLQSYAKLL
jgi:hypothetical protein